MQDLHKAAVITGGASGIGAAIARALASAGYGIHLSYNRSGEKFETIQQELTRQNVTPTSTRGDITDPEICRKIIEDCIENHNRIDAVILNAGIFVMGGLDDLSGYDWDKMVKTNLSSAVYLLKNAMPYLRNSHGSIVFIGTGSISNPIPAPEYPLYEASKSGLYVLMKSLSVTEAQYGVRVNMVSPGMIDAGNYSPDIKKEFETKIPLGKLGKPEDVANAVLYLISDDASYVNGANLDVTGGWLRDHHPS